MDDFVNNFVVLEVDRIIIVGIIDDRASNIYV